MSWNKGHIPYASPMIIISDKYYVEDEKAVAIGDTLVLTGNTSGSGSSKMYEVRKFSALGGDGEEDCPGVAASVVAADLPNRKVSVMKRGFMVLVASEQVAVNRVVKAAGEGAFGDFNGALDNENGQLGITVDNADSAGGKATVEVTR